MLIKFKKNSVREPIALQQHKLIHSGPVSQPTFATCCKSLVGCKNCMDTWYESLPPASYPKCMSQDGTQRVMTGLYEAVHALRNNSPY
ncbi:hypothetical protein DPMN_108146 [Dreissena polymorpha]|uniref:Uncharacterized protein n=1 Tax=Dreissena polymorpha TaxID=45954 RepID=A0A9D4K879_DREPO|nr:hypothetical protein DPMN_108146 [Dreissena polymorpha]